MPLTRPRLTPLEAQRCRPRAAFFKNVIFGGYDTAEVDAHLSLLMEGATNHGKEQAVLHTRPEELQDQADTTPRSLLI